MYKTASELLREVGYQWDYDLECKAVFHMKSIQVSRDNLFECWTIPTYEYDHYDLSIPLVIKGNLEDIANSLAVLVECLNSCDLSPFMSQQAYDWIRIAEALLK